MPQSESATTRRLRKHLTDAQAEIAKAIEYLGPTPLDTMVPEQQISKACKSLEKARRVIDNWVETWWDEQQKDLL